MNKIIEALEAAIELMESMKTGAENFRESNLCIVCCMCEEALEEAKKQEPVGIVYSMQDGYVGQMVVKGIPHGTKLYVHELKEKNDEQ